MLRSNAKKIFPEISWIVLTRNPVKLHARASEAKQNVFALDFAIHHISIAELLPVYLTLAVLLATHIAAICIFAFHRYPQNGIASRAM